MPSARQATSCSRTPCRRQLFSAASTTKPPNYTANRCILAEPDCHGSIHRAGQITARMRAEYAIAHPANTNGIGQKMRLQLFQNSNCHRYLHGLLIFATPGISAAESLAGNKATSVSTRLCRGNPKDQCTKVLQGLCGGQRPFGLCNDLLFARRRPLHHLRHAAERTVAKGGGRLALQSCQAGLQKWKVKTASGGCAIALSK